MLAAPVDAVASAAVSDAPTAAPAPTADLDAEDMEVGPLFIAAAALAASGEGTIDPIRDADEILKEGVDCDDDKPQK